MTGRDYYGEALTKAVQSSDWKTYQTKNQNGMVQELQCFFMARFFYPTSGAELNIVRILN